MSGLDFSKLTKAQQAKIKWLYENDPEPLFRYTRTLSSATAKALRKAGWIHPVDFKRSFKRYPYGLSPAGRAAYEEWVAKRSTVMPVRMQEMAEEETEQAREEYESEASLRKAESGPLPEPPMSDSEVAEEQRERMVETLTAQQFEEGDIVDVTLPGWNEYRPERIGQVVRGIVSSVPHKDESPVFVKLVGDKDATLFDGDRDVKFIAKRWATDDAVAGFCNIFTESKEEDGKLNTQDNVYAEERDLIIEAQSKLHEAIELLNSGLAEAKDAIDTLRRDMELHTGYKENN